MPLSESEILALFEGMGFEITNRAAAQTASTDVDGLGEPVIPLLDRTPPIRRAVAERASRWEYRAKSRVRDVPLWIEVWPSIGDRAIIGVTAISTPGMGFTGPEYQITHEHLPAEARRVVQHIEDHVLQHLCPQCGSTLKPRQGGADQIFACGDLLAPYEWCDGGRVAQHEVEWTHGFDPSVLNYEPIRVDDEGGDSGGDDVPWRSHARDALAEIMEGAEFDETERVIRLPIPDATGKGDTLVEEFTTWEEVQAALTNIAESELCAYTPREDGEYVFSTDGDDLVSVVMTDYSIEEFFDRFESDDLPLFRLGDLLVPNKRAELDIELTSINQAVIEYLARHPEKMFELHPRKFEELVAEVLRDRGWDVELTPATRDGGHDIKGICRTDFGRALVLVECKRYAEHKRVPVDVVRSLHGVINMEPATKGLIVTTSRLTIDARDLVRKHEYRLDYREFDGLVEWLNQYGRRHHR